MISSSDVPACPACGSREVHPVQKVPDAAGALMNALEAEDPVEAFKNKIQTFYACRQCGRDQTDAWAAVQPEKRPEPGPLIGLEPSHAIVDDVDPLPLGIGAGGTLENGNGSGS